MESFAHASIPNPTFLNFRLFAFAMLCSSFLLVNNDLSAQENEIVISPKLANGFDYSLYPIIDTDKVRLAFKNPSKDKVTVKIYDTNLNLLHEDQIGRIEYYKTDYDLAGLGKKGSSYNFQITWGGHTKTRAMKLWGKSFESNIVPSYPNPKKIHVSYKNANEPVQISVSDKEGQEVFRKVLDIESYEEVLNLSSLNEGVYVVKVASEDDINEHQIYIN